MSIQPMSYPFKALAARITEEVFETLIAFEKEVEEPALLRYTLFAKELRGRFLDFDTDQYPDEDLHTYMMEEGEKALNWLMNYLGKEERITREVHLALSDLIMWLDELDHLLRGFFEVRELAPLF